jgi:hypothetical protein
MDSGQWTIVGDFRCVELKQNFITQRMGFGSVGIFSSIERFAAQNC